MVRDIPPTGDPRTRKGQGLDAWAAELVKKGLLKPEERDDFIEQDNAKEEGLEKRKLPGLRNYGLFNSVEEIRVRLAAQHDERFIIRCISKTTGKKDRLRDASLDEVCEFAAALPGGFDDWKVEVKEFVETMAAGTIIVDPSARTIIETWRGAHLLNAESIPRYRAEYDPAKFQHRFHWQAPEGMTNLPELQDYALKALRYIFPHLKPHPNEPIYVEYGVKPSGEVFFIEANDSPLVTGRAIKKVEF